MQWYFDQYFQQGEDRETPRHCLVRYPVTTLKQLVITAGFDPLQDEGKRYVERLQVLGIPTVHHHFENMTHAFLNLEQLVLPNCEQTYRCIARFLNH